MEIFSTAVLALNFDPDLSELNDISLWGDELHLC